MYLIMGKIDARYYIFDDRPSIEFGDLGLIAKVDLNSSQLSEILGSPLNLYSDKIIEGIKQFKIDELNNYINCEVNKYLAVYITADIHSRKALEKEAEYYLYNPDGKYPLLNKLVKIKKQDIKEAVTKILNDKNAYDALTCAYSLGKETLILKILESDIDQLYELNIYNKVDEFVKEHSSTKRISFDKLKEEALSRNRYLEKEIAKIKDVIHKLTSDKEQTVS